MTTSVGIEHEPAFAALLPALRERLESRYGARLAEWLERGPFACRWTLGAGVEDEIAATLRDPWSGVWLEHERDDLDENGDGEGGWVPEAPPSDETIAEAVAALRAVLARAPVVASVRGLAEGLSRPDGFDDERNREAGAEWLADLCRVSLPEEPGVIALAALRFVGAETWAAVDGLYDDGERLHADPAWLEVADLLPEDARRWLEECVGE